MKPYQQLDSSEQLRHNDSEAGYRLAGPNREMEDNLYHKLESIEIHHGRRDNEVVYELPLVSDTPSGQSTHNHLPQEAVYDLPMT